MSARPPSTGLEGVIEQGYDPARHEAYDPWFEAGYIADKSEDSQGMAFR